MKTSPFLHLILLSLLGCGRGPEVVARVGAHPILADEVHKEFEREGKIYEEELLNSPEGEKVVQKRILNRLIEQDLLAQEADKRGIVLSPADEKRLTDLVSERALEGTGLTREEWLARQRTKRKIDLLIDREIGEKITPTAAEIQKYYQKHRKEFSEPEKVRCRQITTTKREKAEKVLALLHQGENFSAIAQKFSESPDREQGGDLGFVARGDLPPVFEGACFKLPVGQLSKIVPSEYGFHLFKVSERRPPHLLSLKEATPQIIPLLKETKKGEALRAWLDSLYKGTKIVIYED